MKHSVRGTFGIVAALALAMALAAPAHAATKYTFTKVADSVRDDFNPNSFTCSSINNPGDIGFKAGRTEGLNSFDGIYRVDADGTLTTIAEDPDRSQFGFLGNDLSMNDLGEVSFGANLAPDLDRAILRGDGTNLTTIATTTEGFDSFGFDTSVNNDGEVAFKGELDDSAQGLFSGSGGEVTTHYLNSTDALVDGEPVRFGVNSNFSRPSLNNIGDIAFDETIDPNFSDSGIFVGREGSFRTIAAPDRAVSGAPVLNDEGTAAFQREFFDETTGVFVTEIVTGNGGPLTTVADTRGPFAFFGPSSLNNLGDVAFEATLDDSETDPGIFVGPSAKKDGVIAVGDKLDRTTVIDLRFCEEGLNDSGQIAFIATLEDPDAPNQIGFRTAVFSATPKLK